MPRKETEHHVREVERTVTVTEREIHRRITVYGARNLADAQRILTKNGIDVDLSSAIAAQRSRRSRG